MAQHKEAVKWALKEISCSGDAVENLMDTAGIGDIEMMNLFIDGNSLCSSIPSDTAAGGDYSPFIAALHQQNSEALKVLQHHFRPYEFHMTKVFCAALPTSAEAISNFLIPSDLTSGSQDSKLFTGIISSSSIDCANLFLSHQRYNFFTELDSSFEAAISRAIKLVKSKGLEGIPDALEWVKVAGRAIQMLKHDNRTNERKRGSRWRLPKTLEQELRRFQPFFKMILDSSMSLKSDDDDTIFKEFFPSALTVLTKDLSGAALIAALSKVFTAECRPVVDLVKLILEDKTPEVVDLSVLDNTLLVLLRTSSLEDEEKDELEKYLLDHRCFAVAGVVNERFVQACSKEGEKEVLSMLELNPINATFRESEAFRIAATKGSVAIVSKLLKLGADPSAKNDEAMRKSTNPEIIKLLLADSRVNPGANGNEALCNAELLWESVNLLLDDSRTDPTAGENFVLMRAVKEGRVDVIRRLCADPRIDVSCEKAIIIEAVKRAVSFESVPHSTREDEREACQKSRSEAMDAVTLLLSEPRIDRSVVLDKHLLILSEHEQNKAPKHDFRILRLLMRNPRPAPWTDGLWALEQAISEDSAWLVPHLCTTW
ncbi:hypothetical protein HDU96_002418 [Phlyctochytrium bullatum]|nr:hypothetical protein HDU96_002418 [Phlyctochytrium bullatum]